MNVFILDPFFPSKQEISKIIWVLLEFNRALALIILLLSGLYPNLCFKSREDWRFHFLFGPLEAKHIFGCCLIVYF